VSLSFVLAFVWRAFKSTSSLARSHISLHRRLLYFLPNMADGIDARLRAVQPWAAMLVSAIKRGLPLRFTLQLGTRQRPAPAVVTELLASFLRSLDAAWKEVPGSSGDLPVLATPYVGITEPAGLAAHCTATFEVLLAETDCLLLLSALSKAQGGVAVHVPGAVRPVIAALVVNGQVAHMFEIRHNLGMINTRVGFEALRGILAVYFPGMRLQWLGRLRSGATTMVDEVVGLEEQCMDEAGEPTLLPSIAIPHFQPRDQCCLIGLAFGGQAKCSHTCASCSAAWHT
jgi:hypothetical protein